MPTVEIQGIGRVELGDEFHSLSPEQQNATVQEIAASHKQPQPNAPSSSGPSPVFGNVPFDVSGEISRAAGENWQDLKSAASTAVDPNAGVLNSQLASGKALLAAGGLAMSLITGPARAVIGTPFSAALKGVGKMLPDRLKKPTEEELTQAGRDAADTAMSGLAAGRGAGLRGSPSAPTKIPTGPLDVILSEGQTTRDLSAIQKEQAALRGTAGPAAQRRAQEFADQQRQQVSDARDKVAGGLDQFGQQIVDGPQQAAELAQQSIQSIAAKRKAGVTQAYDEAKAIPGNIQGSAFNNLGDAIKTKLANLAEPVIVDDKLTPFANAALSDIERNQGKFQNGLDLQGVDQMRKRLVTFRKDAYSRGDGADGRAASAVVNAFDDHIDFAVNNGYFKGDPRAVQAWNDARAAHADYRSTFSGGKNDPVGRVVEKILGKSNNPAAIPNDVADFMYGSSGVNPSSLNVGVANRVKKILGDQSPEWSAVKQGLFSRLTETPEGVTDMGPGKIAQRVSQFMNGGGKEMAETLFNPVERSLIKQYGDLNRALEVPQAGANWSNTATFMAPLIKSATGRVASLVGGLLSHIPLAGPVAGALIDNMGGAVSNAANMRQIVKQMPLVIEAARNFQLATMRYNKANSPPSRVGLSLAITNFARSLKPLGIELQGAVAGQGNSEQPQGQ